VTWRAVAIGIVRVWWCAAIVAGAVSQADALVCPPEGKRFLQDVSTEFGTYRAYVYRGRTAPQTIGGQELCVEQQAFMPVLPVEVAAARNGDHFFTGEFARGVVRITAANYACESGCPAAIDDLREYIQFPASTTHPPFFAEFLGVFLQSSMSAWTVGAATTPGLSPSSDRIWVPQPGLYWQSPVATTRVGTTVIPVQAWQNHSRLVAYETSSAQLAIYNLPGDWNEVLSPVWDAARHRIWFIESGTSLNRPRVGSFDPDQLPNVAINPTEDFQDPVPLDTLVCRPGQPDAACIKYFDLPPVDFAGFAEARDAASTKGVQMPIHMVDDGNGRLWIAGFWSNNLLSLLKTSGQIDLYPLALDLAGGEPYGRGPFIIAMDAAGKLWVTDYLSGRIAAIDTRTAPGLPSCKTLNAAKQNPCVTEYDVKGAFAAQHGQQYPGIRWEMNSIFADTAGTVWFGGGVSDTGPAPLAGYLKPSTGQIVFLPALAEPLSYTNQGQPKGRTLGLRPAGNGADIWGVDYFGAKLYLLKKQGP
jgi:hypothetical protein